MHAVYNFSATTGPFGSNASLSEEDAATIDDAIKDGYTEGKIRTKSGDYVNWVALG